MTALEGTDVLVSKKDRAEVFFMAPTATGKKAAVTKATSAEKPITHSLETLGLFAPVKVSPPTSAKDVPSVLESLKKKTAEFVAKQVKEAEERKAEREAAYKEAVEAYEKAAAEAQKFAPKTEEDF